MNTSLVYRCERYNQFCCCKDEEMHDVWARAGLLDGHELIEATISDIDIERGNDVENRSMLDVGHFFCYYEETIEGEMSSRSTGSNEDEPEVWIDGYWHNVFVVLYEVLIARRLRILKARRLITETNNGWNGEVLDVSDDIAQKAKIKKRCLLESQVRKKKKNKKNKFAFCSSTK